jgi:hypothetical protein
MSTSPTTLPKDKYKIRNWQSYNKSLCRRGSLTLWLHDSVLKEWEPASKKKKEVGEQAYPDSIIQCCILMKINYGLRLRQSTGFMESLLQMMGKGHLSVPGYTALCRRQKSLPVEIGKRFASVESLSIGIDSTGLKVLWRRRMESTQARLAQAPDMAQIACLHKLVHPGDTFSRANG